MHATRAASLQNGDLLNRYRVKSSIEGSNPSLSDTESISFRICHLNSVDHPHLAGKPRFCHHSENQVHCKDDALTPEFSEGNSGSSFLNENGPQVRCLAWLAK
jgi:hypothetical protein